MAVEAGKCCRLLAAFKSDKHSLLFLRVVADVFLGIALFFFYAGMCCLGVFFGLRVCQSLAGVTKLQAAT